MTEILVEIMVVLLWWLQSFSRPGRQSISRQGKSMNIVFLWLSVVTHLVPLHFHKQRHLQFLYHRIRASFHLPVRDQCASSKVLVRLLNSIWNLLPPHFPKSEWVQHLDGHRKENVQSLWHYPIWKKYCIFLLSTTAGFPLCPWVWT